MESRRFFRNRGNNQQNKNVDLFRLTKDILQFAVDCVAENHNYREKGV